VFEDRPAAFSFDAVATPEHIDALGHVNHKVYVAWAEEAGVTHWARVAPLEAQARWIWVASRLEIEFYRETIVGERVRVETWLGEPQGVRFDRFVRILSVYGVVKARARTTWALLDAARRRPARVPAGMIDWFR
jgi:acyl-CoA thioester hydrolase